MNEYFLRFNKMLLGLQGQNKLEAVKLILSKYKEKLAVNDTFYKNPELAKQTMNEVFSKLAVSDMTLENLIKLEALTPYTVFKFIIDGPFSDITIHSKGIKASDNELEIYNVDPSLNEIYTIFFNHLIENVMFISNSKFDPGNALLDSEVGSLRFHLVHGSLNCDRNPVIVIRKQVIKKISNLSDNYIESIGCSDKQKEIIQNIASENGNIIIFGQTGSGKTTLAKYMGNYNLASKRNLITIEDTRELGIDVPIARLTNNNYGIKELFTSTLRENPSSVIIGETRTDEIVDILEASLTIPIITTIHANSFPRAIQRIIFMSAERNISSEQMKELISASVDCFAFMENRKLKELYIHKKEYGLDIFNSYEKIM